MSEQPIHLLSTDAITWLRDMGCDEPTDDVQRTFYGLRSKEKTSKLSTNSKPNTELKINTFNIEEVITQMSLDADIILIEGLKSMPYPKIEVHRKEISKEILFEKN